MNCSISFYIPPRFLVWSVPSDLFWRLSVLEDTYQIQSKPLNSFQWCNSSKINFNPRSLIPFLLGFNWHANYISGKWEWRLSAYTSHSMVKPGPSWMCPLVCSVLMWVLEQCLWYLTFNETQMLKPMFYVHLYVRKWNISFFDTPLCHRCPLADLGH